jgi:hypothetical protein
LYSSNHYGASESSSSGPVVENPLSLGFDSMKILSCEV